MLLDQAEQEMCLVVVVSSDVLDGFPHPLGHPEQVSVEAVLSIAVAAFTPRHEEYSPIRLPLKTSVEDSQITENGPLNAEVVFP